MITDINSEDRLVQQTFADYLHDRLGWDNAYAWNTETFGPNGTLGRTSEREVVLSRDLRAALQRLNPTLPPRAIEDAIQTLTRYDFSRSTLQHNQAGVLQPHPRRRAGELPGRSGPHSLCQSERSQFPRRFSQPLPGGA
jgi:hypothetical protein